MTINPQIQSLLDTLTSKSTDTRTLIDAIHQLGDLKAAEAVPALIDLLEHRSIDVQMAAIEALGEIGDERAVMPLETLLRENDGDLAVAAKAALESIHRQHNLLDDHPPRVGAIPDVLFDSDEFDEGEAEASPPEPQPVPQAPPAPAPAMPAPGAPPAIEAEEAKRRETATGSGAVSLEDAVKAAQEVQFAAYYPREIRPDDWQPVHAYIFRKFAEEQIAEDAGRQIGPLAAFRRIVESARRDIPEGEMITATPHLPGFQFNPPSLTVAFYEAWHRFDFKLRAKDAPLHQAANGVLTFTAGGIILADVPLSVFVTQDVSRPDPQPGETRPIYDTVFASYSHRDTRIVERVESAAKALGMSYLRDVISLRSGEKWSDGLLNMIEQATIFQLFWSAEYAQSQHCRAEWEYALRLGREQTHFIRPVYWLQPMPDPPPELAHLHFAYLPDLVN